MMTTMMTTMKMMTVRKKARSKNQPSRLNRSMKAPRSPRVLMRRPPDPSHLRNQSAPHRGLERAGCLRKSLCHQTVAVQTTTAAKKHPLCRPRCLAKPLMEEDRLYSAAHRNPQARPELTTQETVPIMAFSRTHPIAPHPPNLQVFRVAPPRTLEPLPSIRQHGAYAETMIIPPWRVTNHVLTLPLLPSRPSNPVLSPRHLSPKPPILRRRRRRIRLKA